MIMSNFNQILELMTVTYVDDGIGQKIPVETPRQIFCDRRSIASKEFFDAGQTGIKAAQKFVINLLDYQGETKLVYDEKTYHIYRTYETDDYIELYCEVRAGG